MEDLITNTNLDFLSGGGEMGERIRNFDWSKTPLGNPDTWESSLKTCVRIMLTSPQPMFVWWGEELINIYNDAYRDVLGGKHPAMLGVTGKIVWKEIWDELWKRGKTVFEKNEGTFDDALLLIMNRYGFDEETYFKFSYNPIPGTKKTTEGLFCVCTEETQRIINERALDTLRKLGAIIFTEKSLDVIYRNVAEALSNNNKDFPFALVYKITGDARLNEVVGQANIVTVAASTGIDKSQHVFPDIIDITKPTAITNDFCEAFRENKMVISEIKADDITLPTGAWQTAPKQFIHLPISPAGGTHPYCIISAALNPYRQFDDTYRQFCQLIADRVSIEINKMLALEIESKRAEALAEIDRAKIVFFSNISHEFRTPLTLMLSPLEDILSKKKNNLNKREKQNIEIAQRNALRLLKLVNTLLDFSSIEKGKQQAIFSLVDLVVLTKNLAANFRAVIEKAGMKLIVKADTIIQPVYVDKQMWEKIVFNLLSNAFKYTLEGKITVELSAEKDFAVLKIKDTGVGIPANELPKMFERFHRIQNAAGRTYDGSGIGLSLIKEMVLLHHGEISVDSVLNKGSVFTIKIPFGKEHLNGNQISKTDTDDDEITSDIYIAEIETLLEKENKEALKTTSKEKNNFPTVLVVDDNADMREHISSLLSNNFNPITATNGMDALQKMKETTPDLVLADIMMPVMDGIGLLKEIKSNKATANIPVIFLTARAGEESRIEGWEMGADDYLVKPFSSKELLSRVKAQIKMVKLRQSREGNLRNLFSKAPALICVFRGPQHVYEHASEMFLQLLGNRDIIGKPAREALPEAERQGYLELLDNVYTTGEPFIGNEMPAQLDKGNGKLEEVYFNFVYQPTHNSDGVIDGIFVHGVDVTEQVLARKKIEESNQKIRNLIAQAPVAMCLYKEPDFKVEIVNEKMLQIWGKGFETVINKPVFEAMPDAKGQGFEDLLQKVYTTGKSFSANEIPITLLRKGNNEKIYVNLLYEPYRETDGTITGIVEIANDVTAQVLARKKIKENEMQLQSIFFNAPAAIAVIRGPEHTYVLANDEYQNMVGRTSEQLVGKTSKEIFPELIETGTFEIFDNIYESGKSFSLAEYPVKLDKNKDGNTEQMYFRFSAVPLKDTKGKFDSIVIVSIDITEQVLSRKKIEESEERFKLALMGSNQIVFRQDKNLKHTWIYNSHPDFKPDDIIGKSDEELHVPVTAKILTDIKTKVLNTGKSFDGDVEIELGGQLVTYTLHIEVTKDANSAITGITGMVMDITEKLKAQQEIKESEERFRSLAQSLPQLVWVTNAQGISEFASERWKEYSGIEPGGEKEWKAIVHPNDYDTINAEWMHSVTTGTIYRHDVRLKSKTGKYRWHTVVGEPTLDKENKIVKWVGAFTDVHEQKEAAEKIRESDKQFSTLANNIQNLAWIADHEGWIFWYNQRWYDYTGTTFEEMEGWGWQKVHHPDHVERILEFSKTAWKINKPFELTFPLRGIDGKFRWFLTRAFPVTDAEGKITSWIGTNTDIEEQKTIAEQLEEKVNERTAQLNDANQHMEEKNTELQNKNKELEAFTYISSHDLQEPLRKIQTYAGRIIATEKEQLSDTAKEYFSRMQHAAKRMQMLILDLLSFSRLNTSEKKFEITDLNKIVDEVKTEFKEAIVEKNATIIASEMCEINLIPFQFRQLMLNLIGNALKFSKPDVPLRISIKSIIGKGSQLNNEKLLPDKIYCHISVADNGIGFENQYTQLIFQVFQKLHGKEKYAGTGIGLAIVKKIVENHNGIISAESELGKGATFNIYLPV